MIVALSIAALVLSVFPAVMFARNLPLFRAVDRDGRSHHAGQSQDSQNAASVSVLVPARDEELGIGGCIESALASEGAEVEVVVLDDESTDRTAEIVQQIASTDSRVRLIRGRPLPDGWNGKQHACAQLAEAAKLERLLFLDADVRLESTAIARLVDYQDEHHVDLMSAFPHQTTKTWSECWLIPMMHFILLCYLPFSRMRANRDPSLAAGCGQLFLTPKDSYRAAGTHEAIKETRHDGIRLPRQYRTAGLMSDVVDGTDLADCRMYRGAKQVFRGLLKNADEGIANPRLILVFTVLLFGCSGLPVITLMLGLQHSNRIAVAVSIAGFVVAHVPRFCAAACFRQSWFGAICHVPATLMFLGIQWVALIGRCVGFRVAWRGRLQS